jgi:hypothetical protein
MGAPTSAILVEVYIQYTEHIKLYPILKKHQIIGYFREVHDILILYIITNIDETLTEFSKQTTSIKFTIEKEQHNSINFLDLTKCQKIKS